VWSDQTLKTRNIVIGILIIIALTGAYLYTNYQDLTLTLDTNGTDVTVKSSSIFPLPGAMTSEMKEKAITDIQDQKSTVESIKADMTSIAIKYNYTVNVRLVSQYGENQLPMPATVKGTSMIPTLKDGQGIVLLKTDDIKVGDIVVAVHPQYNLIVKRVAQIQGDQVYLMSDNRQKEIIGTQQRINNGRVETVTIEKVPLDTWLPLESVIGVVKVY
jgi:hypothetical protein